ncbi:MAG: hypothetical protein HY719_09010, partial [Planctomycetes bacterium]|nr:hypothetical protein [Planctomycetota bacterium]
AVYVGTVGGKLYGFGTENHPPTAPTNPAPGGEVNITDTNQPTFTWTMASDPDAFHAASDLTYVIEVTVEGQTNLFTVPGTQASFQYPAAIPIDSKVVWRVRARDPWNAESPWTLFQTFFINKDLTPPADVTNLVGIPVGDRVDLSWAPSASPDVARYGLSYRVESGAYGSEIDAGGATAKSVGGLSLNVVYVFRVRAYDRRENGSAGAELTVLTAPTDTVPPTLLSADFRDTTGAGEVGEATLTFSERVRDGSLTPAGFALNGAPATAFATGAAADDAVIVLKWSPAVAGTGNLALTYAPAVGGLTDLMGNPMAAITAGGFAAGDSVPPVVSSAFARDNAQPGPGPDADDTVVITFSEATNKAVINANNIDSTLSLSGGHTWLSANGSLTGADWSGDGATLTVRLSVAGGAPTVAVGDVLSVRGGLIKDTTGNAAGGTGVAISGLFEADAVPPQLLSATLLDTQRKGSIDQVRLRYTEPVQTATLRAGGVKVNGQAASAVVAGSAADTTVTVTLSPAVAGTGLAQVTYSAAAGALKDLGNNLAPDVPESATVEVDAAAPLLAGPVEVFDANGNGFLDRVEIPFTETMSADAAHRDIADLSLTDADGSTNLLAGRADAHLSVSVAKVTVTLADSSGTKGMPLYRFVENGNGKYIRDLAGNMPPSEGNGSRPVANAGPDQTAPPGVIIISGAGSTDADAGATLTYAWTQAGGQPVSLALPVAGGAGPGAQFLAVLPGTYLFSLTVSDGLFTSLPDSVAVTIQNVKPTAVGMNRTVFKDGDSTTRDLTLSAETSTDANSTPTMSDIVSYIFQQVAGPAPILPGAIAQAGGVGSPTAALDSDLLLPGVYTFEVTVTDRGNLSDTATFTVVVNGAGQTVPLADPGYDRAVERGQTVTLDASRSLDADGDVLTYRWRRVSGPALELSDATAIRPTFYAQELGACLFELMVDDGKAASLPKTVTITVVPRTSRVPLADAGTDVADARVGAEVKLDGTRSAVADGNIPSWLWEQTAGTVVELRDRYTPTPRFTPVQPGAYRFKVTLAITVNAENGEPVTYPASDTVDVTVSDPANAVPVAAVVTPVKGDKGQEARLDGSGSRDPENATLIWFWTQTAGVSVNLKNVASATPSFVPSVEGNYAFDLRVSDGRNFSQPVRAEVIVSGANHAPVLAFEVRLTPPEGGEARVASPDDLKAVVVNSQVLLDLSASSDPDNNALTWFVTQKSGEILTMDGAGRLVAVTPKKAGNYSFEVFVDDGKIHSAATTIAFTVITKDEVVAKQKDADQERRVTFTPVSESVSFCGATAHHAPPSADMRAEVERAAGLLLPAAGALLALLALRRRARLARAG